MRSRPVKFIVAGVLDVSWLLTICQVARSLGEMGCSQNYGPLLDIDYIAARNT